MRVTDTFEIRADYGTDHAPGLVVVLDTLISKNPESLVGRSVHISTPSSKVLSFVIYEAKEHGVTNSLFFENLKKGDIPVGSDVRILAETGTKQPAPAQ